MARFLKRRLAICICVLAVIVAVPYVADRYHFRSQQQRWNPRAKCSQTTALMRVYNIYFRVDRDPGCVRMDS